MLNFNSTQRIFLLSVIIVISIVGCSKMDRYHGEFISEEITYVGKADSLKTRSGKNRIELSWLATSDPTIVRYKLYWNNHSDSLENGIIRTGGVDTIRVVIDDLSAGVYQFEVIHYDKEGNSSVKTTATGKVYDDSYERYLTNRVIDQADRRETGEAVITWNESVDPKIIGVELIYLSASDENIKLVVPPEENSTVISDLKSQSDVQYRTMFKPDSNSIDTFYAGLETIEIRSMKGDITEYYLKNYTRPFLYKEWDGVRWGTVSDWYVNDGAKTMPGGYGTYDGYRGRAGLAFQKGKRDTKVYNGKVYQTISLPAGEYEFKWQHVSIVGNAGNDARYLVVAQGKDLPNVENLTDAISSKSFVGKLSASVVFSLNETTEISLGLLVNFTSDEAESFMTEYFQLIRN